MKNQLLRKTMLIAGIVVSGFLIANCGKKKEADHQHTEAEHTTYACPMHPEITGKEGDTCSKCGMKLEAIKADTTKTEHNH